MTLAEIPRGLLVTTAPGHDDLRALLAQSWPAIEAASRPFAGGRGGVRELPGGLLIRHCRRGGALGGLLGDRHWSPKTAWDEMQMSEKLMREGVAVAEVLAVRAEKRGLAWRLDVVTRTVENAATLRDLIAGEAPRGFPPTPVAAAAAAVRRMHDSGLWHADLNLQNILVTRDADVRIIDLAGSKVKRPLPERARLDNLARLYRSLEKQHLRLPVFSLLRFLMVYFVRDRGAVKRSIAAAEAKMRRHRFWWAVTGKAR
ncbi:MAG: 3-deoxy-D-manno-octulosonic acid [Planctomycetota bacterium]|nr:MAG: 3-deoxy-D-manno-octulosonic acid [Planctomycetota bacterium]